VVDAVRLARLLQRVGEEVSRLSALAAEDRAALRADDVRLSAVKYRFVTVLEAVLDVTHHVLASELWGPADTGSDAVGLLARHGVLDSQTAEQMAHAVGFHNVLVHGYADVDDDIVVANLDRLDDVRAFVQQVRNWASRQT
jgi:uncharacterized protein YutE (UPF0331/DUF86 family)